MVYSDGVHLVADNLEELHSFAKSIGLKSKWFQSHKHKHYDLFGKKKELALKNGACLVSSKTIVEISKKININAF